MTFVIQPGTLELHVEAWSLPHRRRGACGGRQEVRDAAGGLQAQRGHGRYDGRLPQPSHRAPGREERPLRLGLSRVQEELRRATAGGVVEVSGNQILTHET